MGIFRRNTNDDYDEYETAVPDISGELVPDGDGPGGELVPFPSRDLADRYEDQIADRSGDRSGTVPAIREDGPHELVPTVPDRDGDGPALVPDSDEDGDDDYDGPDDEPLEGVVLVDSPEAQRRERWSPDSMRTAERRPVLPGWAKSKAEAKDVVRWAAGYAGHTSAYHAVRAPKYAARLALRSPVGAARTVRRVASWVLDLKGEPVRQAAVQRKDAAEYMVLARHRDARVRWRTILLAAGLVAVLAATIAVLTSDPWVRWTALAVIVAGLGVLGRPGDRPLLDTAVVTPKVAKLTSEVVVHALSALGIGAINQAMRKDPSSAIVFTAPITRDGPGWRAEVDLPPGATASEVIEARAKVAANLNRRLGCVWPEAAPEVHPGRLVLWVGDEDMASAKQPAWPLAKSGTVDLFKAQPFGTDQRGRWIDITLMFASMVIGAVPRIGKTVAMRELALMCALDPRCEIHTYDLKGNGDLDELEPVAHRHRTGDDPEDIEYALADLREMQEDLRRRTKVIRTLPKDVCPDRKVTPELASKKSLRLHPVGLIVDECQRWFEHPQHGEEFGDIVADLVKRGPASGIFVVAATQRPDAKALPPKIADNAILRFCLKVQGQVANDMVLGTSSYQNGIRATMFSRKDRGIGIFAGEGDDPIIVRTVYTDAVSAAKIVARARAARERLGLLTGHAIGETPDTEKAGFVREDTLLEDVLTVCSPAEGNGKFWTEVVLDRLAVHHHDLYGAWTRDQLVAALRNAGVPTTGQVWGTDPTTGKGANRRGIDAHRVADIAAERNRRKGGDTTA